MVRIFLILCLLVLPINANTHDNNLNWERIATALVLVYNANKEETVSPEQSSGDKFEKFLNPQDPLDPQDPPKEEEIQKNLSGMGTGFWIDDKHIITNYHVIRNMDNIQVWMPHYPFPLTNVKVLGYDKSVDIAVLQVNTNQPHEILKFSKQPVELGEDVYAYGHGISLVWSLTSGIVSATHRVNPGDSFVNYIQTDAVINPGNSGGPLINEDGKVVGVNVMILSPTKYYVGYGYSIPAKLVNRVATRIIETGIHQRPSIGIAMGGLDDEEEYQKLLDKGIDTLVYISSLVEGQPAQEIGLLEGDFIVSVNGIKISTQIELIESLWDFDPGDIIKLGIYRGDEIIYYEIPLGERPAPEDTTFGRQ